MYVDRPLEHKKCSVHKTDIRLPAQIHPCGTQNRMTRNAQAACVHHRALRSADPFLLSGCAHHELGRKENAPVLYFDADCKRNYEEAFESGSMSIITFSTPKSILTCILSCKAENAWLIFFQTYLVSKLV